MKALENTLISLLKIPSVTKNEEDVCNWVEKFVKGRFASSTFKPSIYRVRNSLVVHGPLDERKLTVALGGHLDTVPPPPNGIPVEQKDDIIRGLGASDMKGGVAVMLELLDEKVFQTSPYNIVHIYYDCEEGPHLDRGLFALFDHIPAMKKIDFCFMIEPTNNNLNLGCLGTMHACVTFKGKRAHSARPWEGENAIYKGIPLLSALQSRKPREILLDGLCFKEVMSATVVSGGDKRNIVPDTFQVNINSRYAPGRDVKDAQQEVLDLVGNSAVVEFVDVSPSGPVPSNNPILSKFRERFHLPEFSKQAYTDVAVLAEYGIAAVNFGPGLPEQAHQDGEYIPVQNLYRSYEILAAFLAGE